MSIQRRIFAIVALVSIVFTSFARAADQYEIDDVHSCNAFKIKHLNLTYFWGRINGPAGHIMVDDKDPSKLAFDVTIKTADIDTGNPKRDEHLKSPDFFSAKEFPKMTFKSKSAKKSGDNKVEVTGDFTMHGKTNSVTITFEQVGPMDTPVGHRVGFSGELTIKRSDYGMGKMLNVLGDEVTIYLSFEAEKK